MRAAQPFT
nr:unnamed protein product [Callosobruchus analis]